MHGVQGAELLLPSTDTEQGRYWKGHSHQGRNWSPKWRETKETNHHFKKTIQKPDWPVVGLIIRTAEHLDAIPPDTILSHTFLDMSFSSSAWWLQYKGQCGKKCICVPGHAQGKERSKQQHPQPWKRTWKRKRIETRTEGSFYPRGLELTSVSGHWFSPWYNKNWEFQGRTWRHCTLPMPSGLCSECWE